MVIVGLIGCIWGVLTLAVYGQWWYNVINERYKKEEEQMKSLKWTGKNGNEIELRAECKIEMVDKIIDLDGDKINVGREERTTANLEFWVDGKMVDTCNGDTNFWRIIDNNGIKQVWGLRKVGFDAERAELVENFLGEVIAAGKTEEIAETEKNEEELENERQIEKAKSVIAKASKQKRVMTAAEYKRWRKQYNDVVNEGGDGYIPDLVTVEDVEWANGILGRQ